MGFNQGIGFDPLNGEFTKNFDLALIMIFIVRVGSHEPFICESDAD